MKIIAETQDTFVLQADKNEIANLIGYYWKGQEKCPQLKPGDEIQVAKMFQHLYNLERSKQDLAKTAQSLRGLADLLEVHQPTIEAATKVAESA